MADESPVQDVRALWQGQPCEGGGMPLDEIRRRVGEVEKHARRRDRGLYACAAVIIPAWAAVMWWLPDLRVTAAISMAAAFFSRPQMACTSRAGVRCRTTSEAWATRA